MEKLIFDTGIKKYEINGNGVMRFNPSDPNVYARFMEAAEKITKIEETMEKKSRNLEGQENGAAVLHLLHETDKQMKDTLSWVFGAENDFDKILGSVNLMAVASNGERVITNLLQALMPILQKGAEQCANEQIGSAVTAARANREQRRANK